MIDNPGNSDVPVPILVGVQDREFLPGTFHALQYSGKAQFPGTSDMVTGCPDNFL